MLFRFVCGLALVLGLFTSARAGVPDRRGASTFRPLGFFQRGFARAAKNAALDAHLSKDRRTMEQWNAKYTLESKSATVVRVPAQWFQLRAETNAAGQVELVHRPTIGQRVMNFVFGKDRTVRAIKTSTMYTRDRN